MEFRILGPVEAWHDRDRLPLFGTKPRTVLATLAVTPNQPVSTARLIDLTWGAHPAPTARRVLHQYLSLLRRALPADVIVRKPAGYVLRVPGETVDSVRFGALTSAGRAALDAGDAATAASLLDEALALWRGPALADVTDELAAAEGPPLEELRATARAGRIEAELALGRHAELLPELRRLVADRPLDERLRAQLMLALHRADRRAEALDVFTRGRHLLRTELGIEPGAALQRLHRRILAADPALAAPPSAVTTVEPPTAPPPPDPDAAPTTAGPVPRPRQLPAVGQHFVGRQRELARVGRLLTDASSGTPAIVISGMAGAGKTTLAVRAARAAADAFPDGQLYVNLHGHGTEPELTAREALHHLLGGIGVPAREVPADVQQAAALFRSLTADLRLLVLLDNARSAEQVRPLLPGGAATRVLVTSRERLLGLVVREGAERVEIDALDEADAVELIGRVAGPETVAAEPDAARDLARRCGLLPLALRIAAVDLPVGIERPVAARARQLAGRSRLPLLRTGDDSASGVTAVFHHSYDRLAPSAQRVFRFLGLLPVTEFDRSLAVALAGGPADEVEPSLLRLADAHLLTVGPGRRFVVHDLLHEYAGGLTRNRDPAEERAAAVRRVHRWYLDRAASACRLLAPQLLQVDTAAPPSFFAGPAEAVTWLDEEYDHLRSLTLRAAERGVPDLAWRLALALRVKFLAARDIDAWLTVTRAGLRAAEAQGQVKAVAALCLSLAIAHVLEGRPNEAIAHSARARRLSRRIGWTEGDLSARSLTAVQLSRMGRTRAAERQLAHTVAAHGDAGGAQVAVALNNLGVTRILTGRLADAAADLAEALRRHERAGAKRGAASALINLGVLSLWRGQLGQAYEQLSRAAERYEELGDVEGRAAAAGHLAVVRMFQGDLSGALRTAVRGLAALRTVTDPLAQALVLHSLGTVRLELGHRRLAAAYFRRALRLSDQADAAQGRVLALLGLSRAHLASGDTDRAGRDAAEAAALARECGYRQYEGMAGTLLAETALRAGDRAGAQRLARAAADLLRDVGSHLEHAHALLALRAATGDGSHTATIETLLAEAAPRFRRPRIDATPPTAR
ncbi:AfsR/SARP family transcriptional regulator [Micromonospora sp. URMC 103]|uniref:AfsR/SARP family transcriptional regulator n=1 Tax=Micromonospora sp. URMC 103 TaxID=3423406 RepID=UPI003F1BFB2D